MSDSIQIITKEILATVIKKFDRSKMRPQYKDTLWSIDQIDRSSMSKINSNFKFIFYLF